MLIPALLLTLMAAVIGPSSEAHAQILDEADRGRFEAAFHAIELDRFTAARQLAAEGRDPLAKKALAWLFMLEPGAQASFTDITSFIAQNPTWPRLARLAKRAEEQDLASVSDSEILTWFDANSPKTAEGTMRYAAALPRAGRLPEQRTLVRAAWRNLTMSASDEGRFLSAYEENLSTDDHIARLERLLWEGKLSAARRQALRVPADQKKLAEARIALRSLGGGVDTKITGVPSELQNHPGLVYERLRWRRRKGKDAEATELLLNAPIQDLSDFLSAPLSIDVAKYWWRERAILARRALNNGNISQAYRIAADHGASEGLPLAEGEWLAGWIALRFLDDPELAFPHFQTMYEKVRFPVSRSRAAYWAGRSAEAGGERDIALQWYHTAAQHGSSFYGQMAAAHIAASARPRLAVVPAPNQQEQANFEARELVRLARLLHEVKASKTLRKILRHMADTAEKPQEMAMVADLAHVLGQPENAVYAGRQAIKKHVVLSRAGYPLTAIARRARLGPDILLGLMRQESAFDRDAISSAGARGLMQLMPATARSVARTLGLPYRKASLTGDPVYNITLGDEYLAELIDDFDGSLVLALAGYNAGPHRARQWIKRNGDPRIPSRSETAGGNVAEQRVHHILDWIELIPFSETRNYVQRVLENITVYRERLTGEPALLAFSSAQGLSRTATRQTLISDAIDADANRSTVKQPTWNPYPRPPLPR